MDDERARIYKVKCTARGPGDGAVTAKKVGGNGHLQLFCTV
jgi:hypothetical protein